MRGWILRFRGPVARAPVFFHSLAKTGDRNCDIDCFSSYHARVVLVSLPKLPELWLKLLQTFQRFWNPRVTRIHYTSSREDETFNKLYYNPWQGWTDRRGFRRFQRQSEGSSGFKATEQKDNNVPNRRVEGKAANFFIWQINQTHKARIAYWSTWPWNTCGECGYWDNFAFLLRIFGFF